MEDGYRASRQAAGSAVGGLHHIAVHRKRDPLYSRRSKKGSAKPRDVMDYLPADEMTGLVV